MGERSTTETTARELAAARRGAVSRTLLRKAGCSNASIDRLFSHPRWVEQSDQVITLAGLPPDPLTPLSVAVLDQGGDAVVSHACAGPSWGLESLRRDPVHLLTTSSSTRQTSLAVVHRVRSFPANWTTWKDGIPIVRPELLALQLFTFCTPERAARLTDRLWSERVLSGRSIERFLEQLGRRGRTGTAGLRAYFDERGRDYTPPASGLESRADELFIESRADMRRQVDSGDDEHWTGRVDFRHETLPLVIEIQSEKYHSSLTDRAADAARRERFESAGYVFLEITDTMIWSSPGLVVSMVRAATERARRQCRKGNVP